MSVTTTTTISCDTILLRCESCGLERAVVTAQSYEICHECHSKMAARPCGAGFSLGGAGFMIRALAENKVGWRCEDSGRDFCPKHAHLADPSRIEQPTPRAISDG